MATQANSGASSDGALREKTVTVIAYAADQAFASEREMADELDGENDYYARERNVSEKTRLVYDDGERETSERVHYDRIAEALRDADVDSDVLSVEHERDVSRTYKYSPSRFANNVRDDLTAELPDNLSGGVSRGLWGHKWQDENRTTRVDVRARGVDYRRVLAHRTERNGRRKYDQRYDRKRLSVEFTVSLGPDAEHIVDAWNSEVVEPFVQNLADVEWVEHVRVADCTETVEREGDCFDV